MFFAFGPDSADDRTLLITLNVLLAIPAVPMVLAMWRARSEVEAQLVAIVATVADVVLFAVVAIAFQHVPGAGGLPGILFLVAGPIRLAGWGAVITGVGMGALSGLFPQDQTDGTHASALLNVFLCIVIPLTAWAVRSYLRRTTHAIERIEHLFRVAFDQASNGLALVDEDGLIVEANVAASNLLGFSADGLVGRSVSDLTDGLGDLHAEVHAIGHGISPGLRREIAVPGLGGRDRQLVLALAAVPSQGKRPVLLLQVDDVTERRQVEADLAHRATHDQLTRLPNRALLLEHLTTTLDAGIPVALAFLDLDGFKEVNDRFGHAAGDEVLRVVADRLRQLVRPTDLVARLSGDEFVVLCPATDADAASEVAARIASAIAAPMTIGDAVLEIQVSVGIAFPDDAGAEALVARADHAMYQMKARRRRQREVLRLHTAAG
jgi:diguanylate cyclase (GGDEF)-like protein/PAS domain S-box-containing protein